MFPMPFPVSPSGETVHAAPRPVIRPPPGLSLPKTDLEHAKLFVPTQPECDTVRPPPGLQDTLHSCSAWQRALVCETDCCSTDVSFASQPPSPATSDCSEELATAEEAAAEAMSGYVPGRILQRSIKQGAQAAIPLRLEEAVERTTTGSLSCPSVGSAGHCVGLCKPCDFFHRGRCTNAAACKFCHLCGPDEGRRRRKQKQALVKAAERWQKAGGDVAVFCAMRA